MGGRCTCLKSKKEAKHQKNKIFQEIQVQKNGFNQTQNEDEITDSRSINSMSVIQPQQFSSKNSDVEQQIGCLKEIEINNSKKHHDIKDTIKEHLDTENNQQDVDQQIQTNIQKIKSASIDTKSEENQAQTIEKTPCKALFLKVDENYVQQFQQSGNQLEQKYMIAKQPSNYRGNIFSALNTLEGTILTIKRYQHFDFIRCHLLPQTSASISTSLISLLDKFKKDSFQECAFNEQLWQTIKNLQSSNIIDYNQIIKNKDGTLDIVMEQMSGGSIGDMLKIFNKFSYDLTRMFARKMFQSLQFLKAQKLIHANLKPGNILIDNFASIQLSDFNFHKLKSAKYDNLHSVYSAPQVLLNKDITTASDIWSTGCIIYQMYHGTCPWVKQDGGELSVEEIQKMIQINKKFKIPQNFPISISQFLEKIFRLNPQQRPSINDLLDHPFLKDGEEEEQSFQNALSSLKSNSVYSIHSVRSLRIDTELNSGRNYSPKSSSVRGNTERLKQVASSTNNNNNLNTNSNYNGSQDQKSSKKSSKSHLTNESIIEDRCLSLHDFQKLIRSFHSSNSQLNFEQAQSEIQFNHSSSDKQRDSLVIASEMQSSIILPNSSSSISALKDRNSSSVAPVADHSSALKQRKSSQNNENANSMAKQDLEVKKKVEKQKQQWLNIMMDEIGSLHSDDFQERQSIQEQSDSCVSSQADKLNRGNLIGFLKVNSQKDVLRAHQSQVNIDTRNSISMDPSISKIHSVNASEQDSPDGLNYSKREKENIEFEGENKKVVQFLPPISKSQKLREVQNLKKISFSNLKTFSTPVQSHSNSIGPLNTEMAYKSAPIHHDQKNNYKESLNLMEVMEKEEEFCGQEEDAEEESQMQVSVFSKSTERLQQREDTGKSNKGYKDNVLEQLINNQEIIKNLLGINGDQYDEQKEKPNNFEQQYLLENLLGKNGEADFKGQRDSPLKNQKSHREEEDDNSLVQNLIA